MILMPASPLSAVTVAVTSVLAAEPPLRPMVAVSAIAKQAACAAAISSSGLVTPSASPMRRGKLTGRLKAPLPAFAVPLPSMIGPSQFTVTLRENVAIQPPDRRTREVRPASLLAWLSGDRELHDHAGHAKRYPHQQHPVLPGCR